MTTLHHNPAPHHSLNGIHYETPSEFRIQSAGHLPQLARPEGNDHERRASVTSIQKVRLMEAQRIQSQSLAHRPKRELSLFEQGLRATKFDPFAEPEWVDGWNARADSEF